MFIYVCRCGSAQAMKLRRGPEEERVFGGGAQNMWHEVGEETSGGRKGVQAGAVGKDGGRKINKTKPMCEIP